MSFKLLSQSTKEKLAYKVLHAFHRNTYDNQIIDILINIQIKEPHLSAIQK